MDRPKVMEDRYPSPTHIDLLIVNSMGCLSVLRCAVEETFVLHPGRHLRTAEA